MVFKYNCTAICIYILTLAECHQQFLGQTVMMPTTGWQREIQTPINTLFLNEENNYSDIHLYINKLTERPGLNFMCEVTFLLTVFVWLFNRTTKVWSITYLSQVPDALLHWTQCLWSCTYIRLQTYRKTVRWYKIIKKSQYIKFYL